MPEQRARKYHRDRVAETLRDEIGTMLQGELSDPRISFAFVTEVVMNPGGKSARVYVAVDGNEAEEQETLEALVAARGYIRHELLERMGVRHIPDLSFHIDRSDRMTARIDDLVGRMKKRQGKEGETR
jgi:ribosome-binding factor A